MTFRSIQGAAHGPRVYPPRFFFGSRKASRSRSGLLLPGFNLSSIQRTPRKVPVQVEFDSPVYFNLSSFPLRFMRFL